MINIELIASDSKGNAYRIVDGAQSIIIDPGIPFKKLQKKTGFTVARADLCLLTHEHKDHSAAIKEVAKLGVPCLMSAGTAEALGFERPVVISSLVEHCDKGWKLLPFEVEHDAAEPLGFLVLTPSGAKVMFATDTHYIKYSFKGVSYYIIECNYSKAMLEENAGLEPSVKTRIGLNHFGLSNVEEFFRAQDLSRTKEIYLIHLSPENSDGKAFIEAIQRITGKPVYTIDTHPTQLYPGPESVSGQSPTET